MYGRTSGASQVKEIRLVREKLTKASRGFCFVEFHQLESAQAAYDAPSICVEGSVPRISWARDVKVGMSFQAVREGAAGTFMVLGTSVEVVATVLLEVGFGVGCKSNVLLTSMDAVAYSSIVVMRTAPESRTSVRLSAQISLVMFTTQQVMILIHVRVTRTSCIVVANFKRTVDPE